VGYTIFTEVRTRWGTGGLKVGYTIFTEVRTRWATQYCSLSDEPNVTNVRSAIVIQTVFYTISNAVS